MTVRCKSLPVQKNVGSNLEIHSAYTELTGEEATKYIEKCIKNNIYRKINIMLINVIVW